MREKRQVEVIECDVFHTEIDDGDESQIPLEQRLVTPIDVCKECYCDLEDYFKKRFKEEEI